MNWKLRFRGWRFCRRKIEKMIFLFHKSPVTTVYSKYEQENYSNYQLSYSTNTHLVRLCRYVVYVCTSTYTRKYKYQQLLTAKRVYKMSQTSIRIRTRIRVYSYLYIQTLSPPYTKYLLHTLALANCEIGNFIFWQPPLVGVISRRTCYKTNLIRRSSSYCFWRQLNAKCCCRLFLYNFNRNW